MYVCIYIGLLPQCWSCAVSASDKCWSEKYDTCSIIETDDFVHQWKGHHHLIKDRVATTCNEALRQLLWGMRAAPFQPHACLIFCYSYILSTYQFCYTKCHGNHTINDMSSQTRRVTYESCISTLRHNCKSAGKRQRQATPLPHYHLHTISLQTFSGCSGWGFWTPPLWTWVSTQLNFDLWNKV